MPTVFGNMPGGRWYGAIWFFLLYTAAITSSFSMLQPAIACLNVDCDLFTDQCIVFNATGRTGVGKLATKRKGIKEVEQMTIWGLLILLISNGIIIALMLYCFFRVVKIPNVELHEHAPLEIDTNVNDKLTP